MDATSTAPTPASGTESVGIVIVTHNSEDVLAGLLDRLAAALDGLPRTRVVVVDNDSRDQTRTQVVARPDIELIDVGENLGYAAACNLGIAHCAEASHLLLLNADLRPQPGSVRRLVEALDGRQGYGIAVPRLVESDGRTARSLRREPTVMRAFAEAILGGGRSGKLGTLGEVVAAHDYSQPGTADWATGAALLISRRCLGAVGPLDESFFLYSEETDFALRARDAGFGLVFEPASVMTHIGGAAHDRPDLWRLLTVNRVRLHAKRHGRVPAGAFWIATVLNEALRIRRHPRHVEALRGLVSGDLRNPGRLVEPGRRPRRTHQLTGSAR